MKLSSSLKEQYPQMNVRQLPNGNATCKTTGRNCLATQGEIRFIITPNTKEIINITPRISIDSCLSCQNSKI